MQNLVRWSAGWLVSVCRCVWGVCPSWFVTISQNVRNVFGVELYASKTVLINPAERWFKFFERVEVCPRLKQRMDKRLCDHTSYHFLCSLCFFQQRLENLGTGVSLSLKTAEKKKGIFRIYKNHFTYHLQPLDEGACDCGYQQNCFTKRLFYFLYLPCNEHFVRSKPWLRSILHE